MSFDAGSITGGMTFDISQYTRGMMQATSIAQVFPATVTAFIANPLLGVASLAKSVAHGVVEAMHWIGEAVAATADKYEAIGEAAYAAGVKISLLREVMPMAKLKDMGLEDVGMTFMFLNRSISEAMDGMQPKIDAFHRLGVAFTESDGAARDAGAVFYDLADALGKMGNAPLRTALAMDLMGRSGNRNILMFQDGARGIREYAARMKELGAGLDAGKMSEYGEKFKIVEQGWAALWTGIKESMAGPILEAIGTNFESIFGTMVSIGKEIRPIFADAGREIAAMLPMVMNSLPGILKGIASLAEILSGFIIPALRMVSGIIDTIGASPIAIALLAAIGGVGGFMVGGPVGAAVGAGIGAAVGIGGAVMAGSQSQTNNIYVDRPVIRDERDIRRLTDSFVNAQKQQIKEGL